MPIAVRGIISYTLTDEELAVGRDLRRKRENDTGKEPSWPSALWDYTEHEEFDHEIRDKFGIASFGNPITNFMKLFDD